MKPYAENPTPFAALFDRLPINRGMIFGIIIITALFAFEIFNYGTTEFALADLLGDLRFLGIRWATILSIAFCGIDFAGIARLFSSDGNQNKHQEVWYLFGAWMLAASMNAMLTWWGVSLAILNHQTLGNAVIGREVLLRSVPIFIAIMVWLIRVLIIGTFSATGESLFEVGEERLRPAVRPASSSYTRPAPQNLPASLRQRPAAAGVSASPASTRLHRPAPKQSLTDPAINNRELTYHQIPIGAVETSGSQAYEFAEGTPSRPNGATHRF
ncbi:MAG: hypothetical protein JXB15_17065 [Anaerolineales bacterium]|nr:hypothetical protein [Anaerolineales bacterium]